ncbi:NAD(P)-binding protein [Dentipellis sp. KUC8613]|nr:NAD(P)-binding protein [Dentipellis sp. KUC8613]
MSNRVALVTGAAQGIGRAIALQLANDGFDVAVNDVPSKLEPLEALAKEIDCIGRKSLVVAGDVTSEVQVKAMVEDVATKLGSLDVMVANAGIVKRSSLLDSSIEEFDQIVGVNAKGPLLCYKYAAKQMVAQGRGGRLIGAASAASKRPFAGGLSYVMSKFAMRGLTQVAALELGEHNITVNAYAPGYIQTPMLETHEAESVKEQGLAPGELVERAVSALPLKRIGMPQDVANLVSFLASDKASYITGQTYSIDGGLIPS